MTVAFTAGNSAVQATARDLVTSALLELNVLAPGEPLEQKDAAWGLEKLQRLLDQFNTRRALIYNVSFAVYNLQANHSPHTIGPAGDFNVPLRPVRLESAALVLSGVDLPLAVRDDAWWAANRIKELASNLPTNVYYSPDSPLGSLYFWPVPTDVNGVRLQTWSNLKQVPTLDDTVAMPPGYWDAVVLSLAMRLAPSFGAQVGPLLVEAHKQAMKAIEGNNAGSPQIATRAAGMPGSRGGSTGFNFLTGEPW